MTITFHSADQLLVAQAVNFHTPTYIQIKLFPIQLSDESHEYRNPKHKELEHASYHQICQTHIMIFFLFLKGQLQVRCN